MMGKIRYKRRGLQLENREKWWGEGIAKEPTLDNALPKTVSNKLEIANEIIAKIDFDSLKKYE